MQAMEIDDYAQALFDATPHRAGSLAETDFPKEPGIYMFTEDDQIMYIGMAAQGIRERVFRHQLVKGRKDFLPVRKAGEAAGRTRQAGGCNLIYHITWESVGKPLDMERADHRAAWRAAIARVRGMDIRWAVLLQMGAERAAKQRLKPKYGR